MVRAYSINELSWQTAHKPPCFPWRLVGFMDWCSGPQWVQEAVKCLLTSASHHSGGPDGTELRKHYNITHVDFCIMSPAGAQGKRAQRTLRVWSDTRGKGRCRSSRKSRCVWQQTSCPCAVSGGNGRLQPTPWPILTGMDWAAAALGPL